MADAVISTVVERIVALIEEQARHHINLVRGVKKEVRSLSIELQNVRNVLDDAENRRFNDKHINDWLARLEHTSYQMEDVLDEWNYALLKLKIEHDQADGDHVVHPKVCSFFPSSSCLSFKKVVERHDIAQKIEKVKAELDEILKEKDRYNFLVSQPNNDYPSFESQKIQSTSLIDLEKVHGRDTERDILVSRLMGSDGRHKESGIQVVSILGVGGLGKTTLAQLVYNDSRVEKCFELRIWICVSDPFEVALVAKGILQSMLKWSSFQMNITQLDVLLKQVKESISGKRFLLVLDDVWTEDYNKWEPLEKCLKFGGAGSVVLVTTRNETVAKIMGTMDDDIHRPGALTHEDCWLLLSRIALSGRNNVEFEDFEDIGKKIARKCNGLPLAAKTLGSLLRFKNTLEEWENVLNSEIWQLEKAEVEIFPHLLLSYKELSPTLKRCFSYCAVFPKDFLIDVEELIGFWMALGYLGSEGDMEGRGRECFDILATHSLFQDFEKDGLDGKIIHCKMHDIVHDFARFLKNNTRVEAVGVNEMNCRDCRDNRLIDAIHVNEFCCLFWDAQESHPNLCRCLARMRVFSMIECDLQSLPQGMENIIHLRLLNLYGIKKLSTEDIKVIFKLYNLQTLRLEDCNLEEIPSKIGNLAHLRHLNLSCNEKLTELPIEIGKLVELRHLELNHNKSMKYLPREIGKLIELRHLDLRFNESIEELPTEIGNLIHLRSLDLSKNKSLKELPREIGNLIHLMELNLSENESLEEVPREIGNLIQLRDLNLSKNKSLKELPSEIGNLRRLRYLNLRKNTSLKELPESIRGLHELRTLNVSCENWILCAERLYSSISLRTLSEFNGGTGWNKFGLLRNLNHLTGTLLLHIRLSGYSAEEVVEDAREADLRSKIHIEKLHVLFEDEMGDEESESVRMGVIDALQPQLNLQYLRIEYYRGLKLPLGWFISPFNQVRKVCLDGCFYLSSLPPLGKLPCLEEIYIGNVSGFQSVRREFLGIEYSSSSPVAMAVDVVAFPQLKRLVFWECDNWKEWEDITIQEKDSAAISVMPCLTHLVINRCNDLPVLPHRLLSKAVSLQVLNIYHSRELLRRYTDKDGASWKSISQYNPALQLQLHLTFSQDI